MKDYTSLLNSFDRKIVGVGVTAFNRIGLGLILPEYYIACLKKTRDLDILRTKATDIFCLQEMEENIVDIHFNSLSVLQSVKINKAINNLGNISLFVYKSSKNIETIADKQGWQILTNRAEIRDRYENKDYFNEILQKLGVKVIPNVKIPLDKFSWANVESFQKQYGEKMVLRLPEVTRGGGIGISFVENKDDWQMFLKRKEMLGKTYDLKSVVLAKFVNGPSPSITGCASKYGVLSGNVQTQILDITEVVDVKTGSGMFCGHDWSYKTYNDNIQKQAENIVKKFGEYIYNKGYKGIFGLDLLIDELDNQVYACECNPRYTGAFPVYTMLQLDNKEIPLDVFHLLEHMNLDYELDIKQMQKSYCQQKQGSQILITNKNNSWVEVQGQLEAGVYKVLNNQLQYLRPGFDIRDIKLADEFIWTDGCPFKNYKIKPHLRIGKLLFKKSILDGNLQLKTEIKEIVRLIYKSLQLKNIF